MNIEWKTMSLEDKDIVMPYYEYEQSNCCEVSFANNILWAPFYEVEYAIVEGMLVFLTKKDGYSISMPLAKDDQTAANLKTTILKVEEYFESLGAEFYEFIPLTLEEIFITEMEERGYDSSKSDI